MKNRRATLFLALAVLCGFGTCSTARRMASAPDPGVPVVVAVDAVSIGQALDAAQLTVARIPRDAVPQGAFRSPSALADRVLARSVVRGEPILETSLLPEGSEAGLASLIERKARAVSIEIDEFVGVGGFVQPGSRVDVLGTANQGGTRSTQVVLQNVKVLAVDVRVTPGDGDADQKVKVATLEVSPSQATLLTAAEHQGTLKLAMRNPEDDESSRPVQMVLGTDVHEMRF